MSRSAILHRILKYNFYCNINVSPSFPRLLLSHSRRNAYRVFCPECVSLSNGNLFPSRTFVEHSNRAHTVYQLHDCHFRREETPSYPINENPPSSSVSRPCSLVPWWAVIDTVYRRDPQRYRYRNYRPRRRLRGRDRCIVSSLRDPVPIEIDALL